ncbi:uncharacterized protein [Setaria viridis]|uniref:Uncharacterized protein n=1 Tax=Setaria viridis TaxID=4556 RepID=A0A4U6TP69_SETVI|nr:uncharacterized protein LOC117833988 [Setaria viridis]TKV99296.1 hypothetical protein SEVIR_8G033666v2 [Setaria viridis]
MPHACTGTCASKASSGESIITPWRCTWKRRPSPIKTQTPPPPRRQRRTTDRSGKNATPADHGDDQPMKTEAVIADLDEDELFELDIALLDGRGDGHGHHHSHRSHSAAAVTDDGAGHALLASCLLPVQSVSNAVPVPASRVLSLYHPYSGYYNSRRLIFTGGDSRRFLGRSPGSSACFCFSSRGFETMGSYFQRY